MLVAPLPAVDNIRHVSHLGIVQKISPDVREKRRMIMAKEIKKETVSEKRKPVYIPVLNIRMMTDEEWNRLAYKNALERMAVTE